jgi:arylsulfatase A-like enzyme
LEALRRRRLYEPTLVVFVADHGEEFDEHGDLGHGNNLYAETLHVPLVVKWPRQTAAKRIRELAQQVDLFPTVLAAAGLRPPAGMPGVDLLMVGAGRPRRSALSHLIYEGREGVSLVAGDWKLILPLSRRFGAGPELYRLDTDPGERVNLAARDEVRAGWLAACIRGLRLARGGPAAAPAPVDQSTRRALAALGYL